jgi:hypothetical protein
MTIFDIIKLRQRYRIKKMRGKRLYTVSCGSARVYAIEFRNAVLVVPCSTRKQDLDLAGRVKEDLRALLSKYVVDYSEWAGGC